MLTVNVNIEESNVMQEQVAYFHAQHKGPKGLKPRIVTCQWHFTQDVEHHTNKVSSSYHDEFISTCCQLMQCVTVV